MPYYVLSKIIFSVNINVCPLRSKYEIFVYSVFKFDTVVLSATKSLSYCVNSSRQTHSDSSVLIWVPALGEKSYQNGSDHQPRKADDSQGDPVDTGGRTYKFLCL